MNTLALLLPLLLPVVQDDPVLFGIDRGAELTALLRGSKVGIICNHSARDREGRHLIDILVAAPTVEVRALFGPEHGIRGDHDGKVESGKDERTGLPVYSLYGATRKPTAEMLAGIDTLVFDIQDIGARFYTFIATMSNSMETAAEHGLRFVVLDRPNPLGGEIVEGPLLEIELRSFVGCQPIPVRHGMTVGELARLFAGKGWVGDRVLDLRVVPMRGWKRAMQWPALGRPFVRTSPNMPDHETALVYPGLCFLEGTNLSEGRGTERPFLQIGAPFIDARLLEQLGTVPGLELSEARFTPRPIAGRAAHPKCEGRECRGIALHVTDPRAFRPVAFGLHLLEVLRELYPQELELKAGRLRRLVGSAEVVERLERGERPAYTAERAAKQRAAFLELRKPYLLY